MNTPEPMATVDQLALCIDLVRTAWLALQADGGLQDRDIEATASVLQLALIHLAPVYQAVNTLHGRGKI